MINNYKVFESFEVLRRQQLTKDQDMEYVVKNLTDLTEKPLSIEEKNNLRELFLSFQE
jgi:hypothetical protein